MLVIDLKAVENNSGEYHFASDRLKVDFDIIFAGITDERKFELRKRIDSIKRKFYSNNLLIKNDDTS